MTSKVQGRMVARLLKYWWNWRGGIWEVNHKSDVKIYNSGKRCHLQIVRPGSTLHGPSHTQVGSTSRLLRRYPPGLCLEVQEVARCPLCSSRPTLMGRRSVKSFCLRGGFSEQHGTFEPARCRRRCGITYIFTAASSSSPKCRCRWQSLERAPSGSSETWGRGS